MATINRPNIPSGAIKVTSPTSREPGSIFRGNSENPTPNIDPNNNYVLPQPGTGYEQDSQGNQSVRSRVLSSSIYKQAYDLFAYLDDKTWAQRLLAIVDSATQSAQSWFDTIGLSQKAEQANEVTYQTCIQQIGALIAEYQSYLNSLPSTQKQQFSDAGVNVALNPSLLSGSSISERAPGAASLAGVDVDNTSDNIASLLSFAGSLTGGVTSIISSGVNIYNALTQRKNVVGNQSLTARGQELTYDIANRTLNLNEADKGFPLSRSFDGENNLNRLSETAVKRQVARERADDVSRERSDLESSKLSQQEVYQDMENKFTSAVFAHFESDIDECLTSLGRLGYENWKSQKRLEYLNTQRLSAQSRYEQQVINGLDPNLESAYRNSMNEYGFEENRVRNDLRFSYEKVIRGMAGRAERGSWVDSLMLMNLYNQGNLGIQDALETAAGVAGKFLNPVRKTKVIK